MTKQLPNPDTFYPLNDNDQLIYIKPALTTPNITAGEFSYYSGQDFQTQVTHHYDFNGDKLIIGKFCQIAGGVEFVMNGANHQMNAVTTFPFFIFDGWNAEPPKREDLPLKGDTVIGNDVWIGQNATIMPGVHIHDGAIIGANSTVTHDIPAYAVAAGNPARIIRKRFDDELITLLLRLQWWNMSTEEIRELVPMLTSSNLDKVKGRISEMLDRKREDL